MREPIILSWSGGKDSALALGALREDPRYDVVGLLTSVTSGYDRVAIHGVRRTLLDAQSHALDIPLHEFTLEPACSNDDYEAAFLAAVARLRNAHPSLERLAFGDLFLSDVRSYRERLLARAGLSAEFPLWNQDTTVLAARFIEAGYKARLVCVDTTQLSATFAGRAFDAALLSELPASVDPCGERGEFHTFVSDGPVFRTPVTCFVRDVVMRNNRFAYCDLVEPMG
jgi:uncharacterized protein (TIGR00290 family)